MTPTAARCQGNGWPPAAIISIVIGLAEFPLKAYNDATSGHSHHSSAVDPSRYIVAEVDQDEQLEEEIAQDLENLEPGDFDMIEENFSLFIHEELCQLQVEMEARYAAREEARRALPSPPPTPPRPSLRQKRRRLISSSDKQDEDVAPRRRPRLINSSEEEDWIFFLEPISPFQGHQQSHNVKNLSYSSLSVGMRISHSYNHLQRCLAKLGGEKTHIDIPSESEL
ncbi:hypothetical protein QAD02_013033 [Eretmocerus hayati]|uniref:Uncharacterized protein n=1 Tax=Eretmocerus hayati TaxID=131215 RepID=A0ACC2P346_9HYME|nr:hypothetical protein QAD02_013033 [Eretmocerus hayati]